MRMQLRSLVCLALFASMLLAVVPAGVAAAQISNAPDIRVTLVNQDPSSAPPGDYVTLLFKVENMGVNDVKNFKMEILPSYPFSLDQGVSAVQEIGTIKGLQSESNAFQVKYKLRVDKDAINGDNPLTLSWSYDTGNDNNRQGFGQDFDVSIENPRTDFDAVAQDYSSGTATIAIANIGSKAASSVIVSIPKQDVFNTMGASASVIGNLDAGDYTIVTFQLAQLGNSTAAGQRGDRSLTVDIAYTDALGIRRTVEKSVSVGFTGTSSVTGRAIQGSQSQSTLSNGILYIVIGAVGIAAVFVVFKWRTRKKK